MAPDVKEKVLAQIRSETSTQEFADQMKRADDLAKVLVKHVANDKGEMLAHVEEDPAFQDVYDYRGGQKR